MSVIRLAFLGTPEFARYHLEQLLKDSHYKVVGVISQPDRPSGRNMKLTPSPVKSLALEHGIAVITPENMKDDSVLKEVASWKAEAAVVVAFGQILPQKFLDLYPRRVVNVHGSLLPRWRGAAPIQRAIEAGDKETGVSLQVMVKKLDAGDVIGSYPIEIDNNMSAIDLHDKMLPLGAKLLEVDFMDYLRGNLSPVSQDESLVTYARKIEKSESKVDWSKSALEIYNHMRGMTMGPGSQTLCQGKILKLIRAHVVESAVSAGQAKGTKAVPGEILNVSKEDFTVACGSGALCVTEVQPESRAKMQVRDYLLGHTLKKGDRLG